MRDLPFYTCYSCKISYDNMKSFLKHKCSVVYARPQAQKPTTKLNEMELAVQIQLFQKPPPSETTRARTRCEVSFEVET